MKKIIANHKADVDNQLIIEHQSCTKVCGRLSGTCNHTCGKRCHSGRDCGPCQSRCEVRTSSKRAFFSFEQKQVELEAFTDLEGASTQRADRYLLHIKVSIVKVLEDNLRPYVHIFNRSAMTEADRK